MISKQMPLKRRYKRRCAICGEVIPFNSGGFVWYLGASRYVCNGCLEVREKDG